MRVNWGLWGQKHWKEYVGVQQQKVQDLIIFSVIQHSNCQLRDKEVAWYEGWQYCALIPGFLGAIISVYAALGLYLDNGISQ